MSVEGHVQERARSANADVRQKAAMQVAGSMTDEDLPLLFELLGDRDWRVRKTVVDGILSNPRETVLLRLLHSLHDPANAGKRNSATEALIRVGDGAVPFIIFELGRGNDVDVRLALINLLGDLRNDDGFETLLAFLRKESDINLLSAVVSSVGKYRRASSIGPLLETLQSPDLWLKFHVIEALGEIGDRTALPSILPLYSEKSLRKPILEAVSKIGDVGTVSFLLRIISQEEKLNLTALRALIRVAEADKPRIVQAMERQLIQRKFREAFPSEKIVPLVEHLHSTPKRDVKNFILQILGWTGDDRAVPVLLDSLEDPESAEVVAQALVDFGPAASMSVLNKLRSTEEDEVTAILLRVVNLTAGNEAVPTLIGFIDHDSAMIRRLALESLGQLGDPSAIDYLLAKLDDGDPGCQQAAVDSVCALVAAFPQVKPQLLGKIRRLMAAGTTPVKVNSLSIFVNIQGEGFPQELLLASKDGDPAIRQKAVSLMGRFSEERFADQLVLSLADEATSVRIAAIQAIVLLRPSHGIEPLISALEDEDLWIRTAAANALGEYRDPVAIDPLIAHLESDPAPVKIAAIEALGKIGSRRAADQLLSSLHARDLEIRRAGILALSRIPGDEIFRELLRCLHSDEWRLRAAGVLALGQRGDERALEEIHALLVGDADTYVQHSAVVALGKLADRSSFSYLYRALENRSILDDILELFVRRKDLFRDQLEQAWRTADSRHEALIAATLQAMKESASVH
ncbi:MAG: HEAT repeat domain-containing protein [Acidobacteriota bacterium]